MRKQKRDYKCLTITKRLQLEALLRRNVSKKEIAEFLGVHISTVYREIKRGLCKQRNSDWTEEFRYFADVAENKRILNSSLRGAPLKLGNDYAFANYIENRICNDGLTPYAVLGEIKESNIKFNTSVCLTTLYSYIRKGVFLRLEMKHLPFAGKRVKRKQHLTVNRPPRGTSIEERPDEVSSRKTFGHWEMDCVCGSSKYALLVLSERLTRKEIIMRIPNKETATVVKCLNVLERKYGSYFYSIFKSITVDNGSEFSDYNSLVKSRYGNKKRTTVYYCHPYRSSERGTNERLNREIRRKIPKGSDIAAYSDEDISSVETWLNNYPRGCLNFKTPNALFNAHVAAIKENRPL